MALIELSLINGRKTRQRRARLGGPARRDPSKTLLRLGGKAQPLLLTVEEGYETVVTALSRTGTVFAEIA